MKLPQRATTGAQFREAPVAVHEDERAITFIASDETVDRYGDVIRVSGWDLRNFQLNPVLLYGHNSRDLPIGQVTKVWIDNKAKQLLARAEFLPEGIHAFADTVWNIVKAKALRAVSVGFLPTKAPNEIKDEASNEWTGGYEWVAQELLELSVVPIPANPAALALSKSLHSDRAMMARLFPGTGTAETPEPSLNHHALRARHTLLTLSR